MDSAKPILDAIDDREPDFENDFSPGSQWTFYSNTDDARSELEFLDSSLRLTTAGGDHTSIGHPEIRFSDFVFQTEIDISDLGTGSVASKFNFIWRGDDNSPIVLSLTRTGDWDVAYANPNDYEMLGSGIVNTFPYDKVSITLISQNTEYMLFINDIPLFMVNDSGRAPADGIAVGVNNTTGLTNRQVSINSIKLWDLENIDTTELTSSGDILEKILSYKDTMAPTFEDDFLTPNAAWGNTSNDMEIASLVENGTFTIPDQSQSGISFPTNGLLNASNFVLKVEYDSTMMVLGESNKVAVQFRSNEMLLDSYNGAWTFYRNQGEKLPIDWKADAFARKTEKNTIILICYEKYFAAYLNDELLYENNEIDVLGLENRIVVYGDAFDHSFVKFDNVRFRNLDGVEFSTTESTTPSSALPMEITDNKGVQMVLVPAGDFIMGNEDGLDNEKPTHTVNLDAFYIDKFEVTNSLYKECVDSTECVLPKQINSYTRSRYYGNPTYDDFPVVYVDWNMANNYCEWRGARLPSEAEWEKAARSTDGRTYPWGEGIDGSYAHYNKVDTTSVGNYEKGISEYGAYDMAGNVWEWVLDWYANNYYAISPTSNPMGPSSGEFRVIRGGAWGNNLFFRSAYRYWFNPLLAAEHIGFRCVQSTFP